MCIRDRAAAPPPSAPAPAPSAPSSPACGAGSRPRSRPSPSSSSRSWASRRHGSWRRGSDERARNHARLDDAHRRAPGHPLMPAVDEILEGKDICICAGSGGVGKTTTSAAIATGMAARGLKVCVLTIDPAKRLADSLGLKELGNEAKRVDPKLFEARGIEMEGEGELWA